MPTTERGPGRPPGPTRRTEKTVLAAALRLFLEGGADALTFNRIAEETGVSRSTIYRHWPDRAALVATMLEKATFPHHTERLTGALENDLHVAMESMVERFEHRPVREFFAALLTFGFTSDNVTTTGEAFIGGLLEPVHDVIADAIARGDLEGETHDLTAELVGPLALLHVLLGQTVTIDDGRRVVERFLALHT
jgi:AcrR family transcriptional regulator